jgi:transposase
MPNQIVQTPRENDHDLRYFSDVDTIAVAVAEEQGETRSLGVIPHREESVRKLIARLGPRGTLRICYEAGMCGYALYWLLQEMGVDCAVIAPSLIPQPAGERVKTDRLDALRLARCHRAGELVPILASELATQNRP